MLPSVAGARLALTSQPSSTAQSGTQFSQQPRVQVQDPDGNPVPQGGVAVSARISSGAGLLEGTTEQNTDEDGAAQFTDLAITGSPGNRALTFSANGASVSSEPIAIGVGTPSASRSSAEAAPLSIVAGIETSRITVSLRDAAGAASPGGSVSLSSTGSGNTIAPSRATANGAGVAEFTYSSTVAETKTLIATANGVQLGAELRISVGAAPTATRIVELTPEPSRLGQDVTVEVEVSAAGGGSPTGGVTVTDGDGASCAAPLDAFGRGRCVVRPPAAGPTTFVATYGGDPRFGGSSAEARHLVNP